MSAQATTTRPAAPRRELPHDPKVVRAELQRHLPQLLAKLFPLETIPGGAGLFTPLNPTRTDKKPGSFVVWRDPHRAGAWKEYAAKAGAQGDIYGLIEYTQHLTAWIDAYWWALDFLGWGRGEVRTQAQAEQDRRRAERDREAAEAKRQVDDSERSAALFKHWLGLRPLAGTLGERYLIEARGIELHRLPRPMGALRFNPACRHFDEDTGEITEWPAIESAMTRGKKFGALHTTWLAPDGLDKAPVSKPKKMRGPLAAGNIAIRLGSGPTGLSPSAAVKLGKLDALGIGEGIETVATVAVARPDMRWWAAGSLSLMGMMDWPDCAKAVVLLQDNDWKPQAQAAFREVVAKWRAMAKGRPVEVVASRFGNDFNDWVR